MLYPFRMMRVNWERETNLTYTNLIWQKEQRISRSISDSNKNDGFSFECLVWTIYFDGCFCFLFLVWISYGRSVANDVFIFDCLYACVHFTIILIEIPPRQCIKMQYEKKKKKHVILPWHSWLSDICVFFFWVPDSCYSIDKSNLQICIFIHVSIDFLFFFFFLFIIVLSFFFFNFYFYFQTDKQNEYLHWLPWHNR